jgi:hypothetical protein
MPLAIYRALILIFNIAKVGEKSEKMIWKNFDRNSVSKYEILRY